MHLLESTYNSSASERTTYAGGVVMQAGRRPRRGNSSSSTVADGETSNRHYIRQWEKQQDGKRADADTCRSLTCFLSKCVTKQ